MHKGSVRDITGLGAAKDILACAFLMFQEHPATKIFNLWRLGLSAPRHRTCNR